MTVNCFKCNNEMRKGNTLPGALVYYCDNCKTFKMLDSKSFAKGIEKKVETGHIIRRGA
jgi:hypothetical protein